MRNGPNGSPGLLDGEGPPAAEVTLPGRTPPGRDPYTTHLRRRRILRVVLWVGGALLVVLASLVGGMFAVTESLGNNIQRVSDVFAPLDPVVRPPPTGQLSILLIGRDGGAIPAPVDTYLLATADQSRTTSSVVAIPAGTRVAVPGHGDQRLDAAQALGGPALQVSAVEALTNVHVDHYAILDFGRIPAAVDQLGGIDVGVTQATSSGPTSFVPGLNHLTGAQVLDYLRQPGLADRDRVQRQLEVVRGLLHRATATVPGGPVGFFNLLDTVSNAVSVDDTLTNNGLRAMGIELRDMRPVRSVFLTAPTGAPGADGAVELDPARAGQLWQAVRTDSVGLYGQQNPADVLGIASP
jgi:LCP family protein required for cell wall assembly